MEFAYIFRALLRRKWIIIISVIVAIGAAWFFTRDSKKIYKSSAQLSTGFTISDLNKIEDIRFNPVEIDVKFNNAIENATSAKVLSLLSYRMMLHDLQDPTPFTILSAKQKEREAKIKIDKATAIRLLQNKLDSISMLSPSVPGEKEVLNYIDVYDYGTFATNKRLKVGRFQRTDYINIDYVSHNPELSAFAVNTLCREFRRFYGLEKQERTELSVVALDSLREIKKGLFDKKIKEKNDYMASNGVLDVSLEGTSKLGQVGNFQNQLIDEQATQKNLIYQIDQLKILIKSVQDQGTTTVKNPVTGNPGSNNDYASLRKQYNDLNAEYIRGGATDVELKKRLNTISAEMQKLDMQRNSGSNLPQTATSLDELTQKKINLEGLLMATTQKISSLQSAIGQLNGGISGMATKSAAIQQLDKEIDMASNEYKEANDRYQVALNVNGPDQGVFKQSVVGTPAARPLPTKRMMVIALAGICAFIISSLVIVGIEFFDQSVKTPSQFQRLTDLPLLGTINSVKLHNHNIFDQVTLFDAKENRENIFRELIRKIRYEIENSKKKIFLFTSTEPQQGKTTLIQSIAYSLSLSKKRVLIIDTNFCNNDLTRATSASPVLEKFSLNGKPFDSESIRSYVTKTAAEGVDIIGCEGGDYTPSEILPKNHLLNYLELLKEEYDFIFMEGAPLNVFTDTKELIKYADGLIAIFSADATYTAADKESISFLLENKEKFLGAILNKVQEDNLNL
jgi:succinoglycan biosynthesis transport protein ExoP